MPQRIVNNSEIQVFAFTVKFDIRNLSIVFDIAQTVFNGSGVTTCQGVNFSVVDEGGVEQLGYDWGSPAIPVPTTDANPQYLGENIFTLDLSPTFIYSLFFQKWRIKGAIRDGGGNTFETNLAIYDLCQPEGFTDKGYVKGLFHVELNCPSSLITVKDLTPLTYKGSSPYDSTNNGFLYYPQGTIDPVAFTSTPFANNQVYTGNYRISNTRIALYDLGNGGSVQIEYVTGNNWDFDCENNIANVLCCIYEIRQRYEKNCNNAIGKEAQQQLMEIMPTLIGGVLKEMRGQDSSEEAKYIRQKLRCDCGKQAVRKVSVDPVNTAIYNIVIEGVGGTNVTSEINGATKTFYVSSKVYSVEKVDVLDEGFSIQLDLQTPNVVKYKLLFDYETIAGYILTSISGNNTLLTQLNSLVVEAVANMSTLNGRCVIDIGATNYFLTFRTASASNIIKSILIGTTTYNFPPATTVNNVAAIETFLNGLSLGTWQVSYSTSASGSFINIFSASNPNQPVSVVFTTSGDVTVPLQATNKSLLAVLQALIDYVCDLSASGVQLGAVVEVCSFSGDTSVNTTFGATATQAQLNSAFAAALCAIRSRVQAVTGATCAAIKAIFLDRPSATLNSNGRVYGADADGNCTSWTTRQLAQAVINSIKTDSVVFNNYCSIPACGAPVSCPDVIAFTAIQLGNQLLLQSVVWNGFVSTSQTLTVRYRVQGDPSYITASASVAVGANGDITPDFVILNNPVIGEIYEIWVFNNCGGTGSVQTVETASCPAPTSLTELFVSETSPSALYESQFNWVGDPAGQYELEYREVGEVSWIPAPGNPITGLQTAIDGFEYNEEYEWRVRRVCDTSSFSEWVNGTNFVYYNSEEFEVRLAESDEGGICSAALTTVYTEPGLLVTTGTVLYTDPARQNPVLGNLFVSAPNGTNYDLDDTNGTVGSTTGNSC